MEEGLQPSSEENGLRVTFADDVFPERLEWLGWLGDSYVRRSPVGIPPLLLA
jgi:hypothetical protein